MKDQRNKIAGILFTISVTMTTFGLLNTFGVIEITGQFAGVGIANIGTFFFVLGFWVKRIRLSTLKKYLRIG